MTIDFRHSRTGLSILGTLCLVVLLGGCSAHQRSWPEHRADHVWTAAVAAANTPEYTDWHLVENQVHADPDAGRIEIVRTIRRRLSPPRGNPTDERRDWQFGVTLTNLEPPVLEFESRTRAIPAWVASEAERYFDHIDRLLSGGADFFAPVPDEDPPAAAAEDDADDNDPPALPDGPGTES